jgi:hypothetical protein
MLRRAVELYVAYRQFYLWDPAMPFEPPDDWTNAEVDGGIKAAPNLLAIAPIRDGTIPVVIEIHDRAPIHDLTAWDQAVEGSLEVVSGRLQLRECLGVRCWEFAVPAGWHRCRALFGNLTSSLIDDQPEADRYLLAVWAAPPSGVVILKQFHMEM